MTKLRAEVTRDPAPPAAPAPAAISARGLRKSFGDVCALDGVDFDVAPGTVLGLLGPNGAGKTTAVRVLTTLLAPDEGSARVAGLDVVAQAAQLRERIGLAGQYAAIDENLTGLENLVDRMRVAGGATRDRTGSTRHAATISNRPTDCAVRPGEEKPSELY